MRQHKINGLENGLWGVYRQRDKDRIISHHERLKDAIVACEKYDKAPPKLKPGPKPVHHEPSPSVFYDE